MGLSLGFPPRGLEADRNLASRRQCSNGLRLWNGTAVCSGSLASPEHGDTVCTLIYPQQAITAVAMVGVAAVSLAAADFESSSLSRPNIANCGAASTM